MSSGRRGDTLLCIFWRRTTTANTIPDVLVSPLLFAEGCPKPCAAPPRIHSRSRHYRFALLVVSAGYPYEEASALVGVSPRTAERWRTDLRRVARRFFGRPVTYEFAARYALDPALRRAIQT